MTDKELIQALRCCGVGQSCKKCPADSECYKVSYKYAADRLEALLAENERLKAQLPKWVSVKERLPENCADVLALVTGLYEKCSFERAPMLCACFGKDGWFSNEYPYWDNLGVTHWMPLPSTEGVE